MEDKNLISTERHEMNYILEKYNKHESKMNREILSGLIKEFKNHRLTRQEFYTWMTDNNKIEELKD